MCVMYQHYECVCGETVKMCLYLHFISILNDITFPSMVTSFDVQHGQLHSLADLAVSHNTKNSLQVLFLL